MNHYTIVAFKQQGPGPELWLWLWLDHLYKCFNNTMKAGGSTEQGDPDLVSRSNSKFTLSIMAGLMWIISNTTHHTTIPIILTIPHQITTTSVTQQQSLVTSKIS